MESKGFEPLDATRTSTVFETAAFSRSANSGQCLYQRGVLQNSLSFRIAAKAADLRFPRPHSVVY